MAKLIILKFSPKHKSWLNVSPERSNIWTWWSEISVDNVLNLALIPPN